MMDTLKWTISMQIAKEKLISTEEEESKCRCMTTHLLFVVVVSEGGIYIFFSRYVRITFCRQNQEFP